MQSTPNKKSFQFFLKLISPADIYFILLFIKIESKFETIPKEIIEGIRDGVPPSMESVLLADSETLDEFVWEITFLLGTTLGIHNLKAFEHDEDYAKWLQGDPTEEDIISRWGFAALALAHELPPSKELLFQLFPITRDDFQRRLSLQLLQEINQVPYIRYIREISVSDETN